MLVIALNRKKIIIYLKISFIIIAVFTVLFIAFEQLPQRISFEKWNAASDHPGRVLRVNFDFNDESSGAFENTLQKIKKYYQSGFKSH